MRKWQVLIAHAEGEEEFAERLAAPIREAGYDVAHRGTVMVGESVLQEASNILSAGGPVVLCGTVKAVGTGWAHKLIYAARQLSDSRVFVVKMEKDAYVEQLAMGDVIAPYWQAPAKAIDDLIEALRKNFPTEVQEQRAAPDQDSDKSQHPTQKVDGTPTSGLRPQSVGQKIKLLYQRIKFTLSGASKTDLILDLLRLINLLLIIVFIPVYYHSLGLFLTGPGIVFLVSVLFLFVHSLYRTLRKPGYWDKAYKLRKSMLATAINYGSISTNYVSDNLDYEDRNKLHNAIDNIEINTLLAIKSYLEHSVMDREGSNFDVNLVVKDPHDSSRIICIQRATRGKEVPQFYPVEAVPTVMRAFETGRLNYKGDFTSLVKPYRMIWHVPIRVTPEGAEVIGILAIDSLKPHHLDLADERGSLHFNLAPYIALLRYSLTLRRNHNIWY